MQPLATNDATHEIPTETAEVETYPQFAEASKRGDAVPEEHPKLVVVGIREDGGIADIAGHGLPDGHPLDG